MISIRLCNPKPHINPSFAINCAICSTLLDLARCEPEGQRLRITIEKAHTGREAFLLIMQKAHRDARRSWMLMIGIQDRQCMLLAWNAWNVAGRLWGDTVGRRSKWG